MDSAQMAKQMISFQKTVFENSFNSLSVAQDQSENMIGNLMGQFPWVTEDGKKQVQEIFAFTKKARDDFKKAIDEAYANLEKLLDQ